MNVYAFVGDTTLNMENKTTEDDRGIYIQLTSKDLADIAASMFHVVGAEKTFSLIVEK